MPEYIVTVKKDANWEELKADLITDTSSNDSVDSSIIPDREVDVTEERPDNRRNTEYDLSDAEADALRSDSRVISVTKKADIPAVIPSVIQEGQDASSFNKGTTDSGNQDNWGLLRHISATNNWSGTGTNDPGGAYNYVLDGTGVDVVIMDSGIQADHPEFAISSDPEYDNSAISNVTGDGSDFFKREVTVNGVRIMAAGTVGGQTAVPDAWIEKVGRMFELFTDRDSTNINQSTQRDLIKTLSGDTGTYHATMPTIQRLARGAGSDYSTNFLSDSGITYWNLTDLFDNTVQNDMVWYLNSSGDGYGDGDNDAQEVIEHVFHTLHMHGLDATLLKMYAYLSSDWASGPLYAAMEEAYDAGKWDSSGYGGNAWKTDSNAFQVAAKEYLFLLNFCMFEYSSLWDGGSLSPEWTDDMRTQAGILTNNPLGYALHNTYIAPVISKPSLATIRRIFQDGNTPAQDDPTQSGASGYVVDTGSRIQKIDWSITYTGTSYTQHSDIYTDVDGHGTHVASTVAGKTFGWAKNAEIYVLSVLGSWHSTGTPGMFDVVKDWHNAKDNNRPTVVNMSFGHAWFLKTAVTPNMTSSNGADNIGAITGGRYRGTTNSNVSSLLGNTTGLIGKHTGSSVYQFPIKVASTDADIEEMTNAGIHVVMAAGNDGMKCDKDSGDDFDNYLTFTNASYSHIYYHRGGSPSGYECGDALTNGLNDSPTIDENDAITVGSIRNTAYSSTLEQKATFSQSGSQVDLYAAGNYISGACSTSSGAEYNAQPYSLNSSYKQAKVSGTSMASPQVAGMVACFLQAHPDWSPKQVKNWFVENATDKLYSTGSNIDYTTDNSIHGGNQRVAYFPVNGSKPFTYTSSS